MAEYAALGSVELTRQRVGGPVRPSADGAAANNGTKANAALTADLFGDWREEVIWRAADNTSLRIYSTTIPATNRIYTLMHDPQYRLGIAWQNMVVASGASQISAAPFASCSCDVVTSAAAIAPTRQR